MTPLQNAHRVRGIGRYVAGLARALMTQQDVVIQFWGWREDIPFEVRPPHRALWLPRFGLPRNRWSWLISPLGMRIRAGLSPARVIHITDPRAFVPMAARTVTTVYDLIPLVDPTWDRTTSDWRAYRRYLERLRRAARLFAISKQTASDLQAHLDIPPPPVDVVLPGVVVQAAGQDEPNEAQPYFLYAGSADRHKNVDLLLTAFASLGDLPERLVIVGPWYAPDREMLARRLEADQRLPGRVEYAGFVSDRELSDLIRGATALVLPSRLEGFGLPVAEALAAGGVVIHSRIPVLVEVSQSAALTFEPGSVQELAEAMRRLSSDTDLRQQLRARGLERARALTWQSGLETTIAVYRALLGA